MPNYVKNILEVEGHEKHVNSFLNSVKSEDSGFDFQKIIPMPMELKGTRSPSSIVSQREYDKWEKQQDYADPNDPFRAGRPLTKTMQKELIEKCGFDNWYDWCCTHWGTKWGSLDVEVSDPTPVKKPFDLDYIRVTIIFDTAWSSGQQVISYVANNFPTLSFHHYYADEDCGYNVGEYWYDKGFKTEEHIPKGGSNEAMDLYFRCWNEDREGWEFVDGEWQYEDEW